MNYDCYDDDDDFEGVEMKPKFRYMLVEKGAEMSKPESYSGNQKDVLLKLAATMTRSKWHIMDNLTDEIIATNH